jgi:hypothetical protein
MGIVINLAMISECSLSGDTAREDHALILCMRIIHNSVESSAGESLAVRYIDVYQKQNHERFVRCMLINAAYPVQ